MSDGDFEDLAGWLQPISQPLPSGFACQEDPALGMLDTVHRNI
jgi:hypothetical protein